MYSVLYLLLNITCFQEAKDLPEGSRVVVILPDSVRNYMTKYLSDDWMIENGFLSPSESDDMSLRWFELLFVFCDLDSILSVF